MPAVDLLGEFRSAVKDIRGERTTQDVIKPVTKRTVFESDARQQASRITESRTALLDARPWYLDALRSSVLDLSSDALDDDVRSADVQRLDARIKTTVIEVSDALKGMQQTAEKETSGDLKAHHFGVISVLTAQLAKLDELHKRLKGHRISQHLKQQVQQAQPQLRLQRAPVNRFTEIESTRSADDSDDLTNEERQQLASDNSDLLGEFTHLISEFQHIDRQLNEISQLEATFSSHLREQAEVIELLFDEAIANTARIEEGNQYLMQATKHSSTTRKFVLLFLIMASLTLLFLDWYS